MHIDIWSSLAFWSVVVIGYRAGFVLFDWLKEKWSYSQALICCFFVMLLLTFAMIGVSEWHWAMPARQKAKAEFYGVPIVSVVQSLEGKVFTPQAFVVTEQHILVYDKDGKVYALDWIKLDGIKPEQLTVASNITYTVYQKGGQMFFGKL